MPCWPNRYYSTLTFNRTVFHVLKERPLAFEAVVLEKRENEIVVTLLSDLRVEELINLIDRQRATP